MPDEKKIAVVTGANRGMGFELVRQLAKQGMRVILTSRDRAKGEAATEALKAEGLDVLASELDVASAASIEQLRQLIQQQWGRLDVLVNNAGIIGTGESPSESALKTSVDALRQVMETNTFGPFQLMQALVPLMQTHGYGRIVNVSSGMGQLHDMEGGYAGYRTSKTALNAITRIFASELGGTNILVNTMCPGWVKTDMGGAGAPRSIEQGIDTMIWLATLPDGGPTGGFFRDRQPIDW